MELITKYPVLVDPTAAQKDQFRFTANTAGIPGDIQTVNVGDFSIKGARPVFEGDRQISENDFIYRNQITDENGVLTPMDEYLYSERNFSEGSMGFGEFENWGDVFANADGDRKARRQGRKAERKTTATMAEIQANLQDVPGGPTKGEQEAKLKEGKFWNGVKGGWDSFKTSPSGQILIDSVTNYLSNKLGGNSFSQPGGEAPAEPKKEDEPKAMSPTTKYVLIGVGVLLVGIIIYSATKKK
jgi:hypothetical protein